MKSEKDIERLKEKRYKKKDKDHIIIYNFNDISRANGAGTSSLSLLSLYLNGLYGFKRYIVFRFIGSYRIDGLES